MRRPIMAGNWKMFKTPEEAAGFIAELKSLIRNGAAEVVVCPPFVDLPVVLEAVRGTEIAVGAQNVHWEDEGAFTGEISPVMLSALGCRYVIIGHSERRQYFGETDEMVAQKVRAAFRHGLRPIVCVGETLAQREEGKTAAIIERQIRTGLSGLTRDEAENLVLAYEPVWAIGTGKNASADDAEAVIARIRLIWQEMYGKRAGDRIRIQYGGSVKPENIKEFMARPDIDGALVGGASLKAGSFSRIAGFDGYKEEL